LLLVAGNDANGLRSNETAFRRLECPKRLVRVASDRFTTRGDTDAEVSQLALDWFSRMLSPVGALTGREEFH
jgi:hypothetical protein